MYSFHSRVRYSEVNQEQALSLTGLINYLQDCSTFQSEDLGIGIAFLKERKCAWWLSSWHIEILRYPKLGEKITVGTWPYAFKGMYGYRNFVILDEAGEYLVKADSTWFFYNLALGRPTKPQKEEIARYEVEKYDKLTMHEVSKKIQLPLNCERKEPVVVGLHHLDTNHHVNNAQYVAIAREVLPENFGIEELRVEYKKAAVLGDLLYPQVSIQDREAVVVLCNAEGAPYATIWMRMKQEQEKRND